MGEMMGVVITVWRQRGTRTGIGIFVTLTAALFPAGFTCGWIPWTACRSCRCDGLCIGETYG